MSALALPSTFRNSISSTPDAKFPPEPGRYYLCLSLACPWAHRVNIVGPPKGMESIIPLILLDHDMGPDGWYFSDRDGTAEADPLYGYMPLRDLYLHADPNYTGRFTVPVLWDSKTDMLVNNESAEVMRMFQAEFDDLLPEERKGSAHPLGGYYPSDPTLRRETDGWNEWMQDAVNNGVYKTGLSGTQAAYDENVRKLFAALDRIESPITEPDIRLFMTMIRFNVAYFMVFRCSLEMIRYGYPHTDRWMRRLYWGESERTKEQLWLTRVQYKSGYLATLLRNQGYKEVILPAGPVPEILPPVDDAEI
ncbi:hypothetical protein BDW71DRAFT_199148 [Aspergillus fruticulosus]